MSAAITPSESAKDLPVVFLENRISELPIVAAALQSAGKGAIVAEGEASDASVVTTVQLPLGEGLSAQVRLGELLYRDGSGGLEADVTVPVSPIEGEQNPALQAAVSLAQNFKSWQTSRKAMAASAALVPENPYAEMKYPTQPYRLLAVFRIWGVINYFYPYKDLMGEDWNGVLREFIPRMESVSNGLEYNLAVAEMVTHIHDGHGFVHGGLVDDYFGASPAPARVRIIERKPVVTALITEQAGKAAGLEVGDVILKVDGEDAMERLRRFATYTSASTPQALMYYAANDILRGPEDSEATVTVLDLNDKVKELKVPRRKAFREGTTQAGEILRLLPGNIGYVDLDRLTTPMVENMFEKFKDTKAIIIDDRTYPHGTAWAIAPRLTAKDSVKAAMFQRRVVMYPDAPISDEIDQSVVHTFFQELPHPVPWTYKGKTVLLIDERTQSQAEHTGLFFEAANGTTFVGSPTAGANGDVTNFCVPGGIWITFSGQGVRHADGRQLQRVGLVPDVEVSPTLKGIRAGQDEVLDKAIEYLQRGLQ